MSEIQDIFEVRELISIRKRLIREMESGEFSEDLLRDVEEFIGEGFGDVNVMGSQYSIMEILKALDSVRYREIILDYINLRLNEIDDRVKELVGTDSIDMESVYYE